jgi:peptidoglycan hydrolase-like protein with peptidoglycan-binding domain
MKIFILFVVGLLFLASPVLAENSTSTANQADTIKQLQEQIKALEVQIAQLTAELSATKKEIATIKEELRITKTLKLGMADEEVKKLQEFLSTMPDVYPEGLVTGYFGHLTEKAVKNWQEKNGIESVGIVGPKTRSKLSELSGGSASAGGSTPTIINISSGASTGELKATTTPPGLESRAENRATTTPSGTIPATPAVPNSGGGTTSATPAVPAQTQDTTAPIISNIQTTNITENSTTITWTTNELSDSRVYFSPVTATSTPISTSSTSVTSHSTNIGNLAYSTTYRFVVVSKDTSGNMATSSEQTFATNAHVVRPDPTGVRQNDRTLNKIYWELGFSSGHYAVENVEVREMPDCVFDQSGCTVSDRWNQQPKLSYPVYTVTEGGDIPGSPVYFNQKFLITVSSLIGDKRYGLVYDIVDIATGYRWNSDFWGIGHPAFTIRSTTSGNGTITPCIMSSIGCPSGYSPTFRSTSATSFTPWDTTAIFYIAPDAGFVGALTVDGTLIGTSTAYTFSNIMANHTIDVIFAPE